MRLQFFLDRVSGEGDLKSKVSKKVGQVEKYLRHVSRDLRQGFVKLSKGERWGYKVKLGVKIPGSELVAEARDKNLLSAIDEASHKLAREVRKRMDKLRTKARR